MHLISECILLSAANQDYTPITNQQLTFDASSTMKIIPLQITADALVENTEFLNGVLTIDSSAYPRVTVNPARSTVNIVDNSPGIYPAIFIEIRKV